VPESQTILFLKTITVLDILFRVEFKSELSFSKSSSQHPRSTIGFRNSDKLHSKSVLSNLELGVVAADDARCSAIGVSMLKLGGHVVDVAFCVLLLLVLFFKLQLAE
jgi:hypothetical protein